MLLYKYYCKAQPLDFQKKKKNVFSVSTTIAYSPKLFKRTTWTKNIFAANKTKKIVLFGFFVLCFNKNGCSSFAQCTCIYLMIFHSCPMPKSAYLHLVKCKYPLPLLSSDFLRTFVLLFKSFPVRTHVPYSLKLLIHCKDVVGNARQITLNGSNV